MYLLDTNILIYFFKGQGQVAKRFLNTPPTDIAISWLTVYELEVGLAKTQASVPRRTQLEELLNVIHLLPFGPTEARASGRLRANLELQGTPIGPIDTLIAGTALAHNVILVTHNVKEFARIESLSIEDWFVDNRT